MSTPTTTTTSVRALSVRQPWADLLLAGKCCENRGFRTHYRGPLVVHASQTLDRNAGEICRTVAAVTGIRVDPGRCVRGAFLGVVDIIGCHHADAVADCLCGVWGEPQAWHWVAFAPRRFPRPLAGAGHRSLFRPPETVLEHHLTQPLDRCDEPLPRISPTTSRSN